MRSIGSNPRNLAIILGSILGFFVLVIGIAIVIICKRRYNRRGSLLGRAITPLDDAEFASWRRPSVNHQWLEERTIRPTTPPPAVPRDRIVKNGITVSEKPLGEYRPSASMKHAASPTHIRNKSSTSIQDRPPTPYSPTYSNLRDDEPVPWTPRSPSRREPKHLHFPSLSEASDFDFGFHEFEK